MHLCMDMQAVVEMSTSADLDVQSGRSPEPIYAVEQKVV